MKSILQSIALVSAILFIVSCDSGGTSGVTNVPITPPQPPPPADPEFGIDGRAVKGVVGGATITVRIQQALMLLLHLAALLTLMARTRSSLTKPKSLRQSS